MVQRGLRYDDRGERVVAAWASKHEIRLSPFLFEGAWSAMVKWKYVLKAEIDAQEWRRHLTVRRGPSRR